MTARQVDAIVRVLSILCSAYEPQGAPLEADTFDCDSYTAGFRAGARSAYADAICRLRELQSDNIAERRIGAPA